MNLINIAMGLFILAAFSIGIAANDAGVSLEDIDNSFTNASLTLQELELDKNNKSEATDMVIGITEKYINFVGFFAVEILRIGVHFGYDNPEYFTPEFIINVMKLLVVALLISLLIKPLSYAVMFFIVGLMWLLDKNKKKKTNLTKFKEVKNNGN